VGVWLGVRVGGREGLLQAVGALGRAEGSREGLLLGSGLEIVNSAECLERPESKSKSARR
jgi:hypothetical protein